MMTGRSRLLFTACNNGKQKACHGMMARFLLGRASCSDRMGRMCSNTHAAYCFRQDRALLLRIAEALLKLGQIQLQPTSCILFIPIALPERLKQHDPLDLGEHGPQRLTVAHTILEVDLGWDAVLR